jgi:hypothetical protein
MKRELVVLVPDADIEAGMRALLRRHDSIGIRGIRDPQFLRHPRRDPGLCHHPEELLQSVRLEFQYALVVLDAAWSGCSRSSGNRARRRGTSENCIRR